MADPRQTTVFGELDRGQFLIAFEVGGDGAVSRWSEGAERVLGWPASEVLGHAPPVAPPPGLSWDALASRGSLVDAELVWTNAVGERLQVVVSATAVQGARGGHAGVSVWARDISARRDLQEQLRVYAQDVRESYGRELQRLELLERTYRATVEALATAVEAKDDTTGGHIRRVLQLGMLVARAHLGPAAAGDPQLEYGFLLHDVGKLAVPDSVLNKPGALDDAEWEAMKRHPGEGARILGGIPFLCEAIDIVACHHERWDGTGYPRGLKGDEIPVGARIFSIVDTVDAMTSDRPYRAGLPLETALDEVSRQAGHQFDPGCVATFLALDRGEIAALLEPSQES